MFKVNNKDTKTTFLLVTLNMWLPAGWNGCIKLSIIKGVIKGPQYLIWKILYKSGFSTLNSHKIENKHQKF